MSGHDVQITHPGATLMPSGPCLLRHMLRTTILWLPWLPSSMITCTRE